MNDQLNPVSSRPSPSDVRSKDEWKDPDDVSLAILQRGILTRQPALLGLPRSRPAAFSEDVRQDCVTAHKDLCNRVTLNFSRVREISQFINFCLEANYYRL
jgi:hypothetical protein